MRRWMSLLCLCLLLVGTALAGEEAVPEPYEPGPGYENLGSTDIYAQPSLDAEYAGHLATGEVVSVLDNEGDWVQVEAARANGSVEVGWLLRAGIGRLGDNMPYFGRAYVANPDPTDLLNLREGPGKDYAVLGLYYNGAEVACWSDPAEGEWVLVTIGQVAGYMQRTFLRLEEEGTVESATPTLVVSNLESGQGLNLREEADLAATVLNTYPNGQQVQVMGVHGDWAHVRIDAGEDISAETGYMLRGYLLQYENVTAGTQEGQPAMETLAPDETLQPVDGHASAFRTDGKGAEGFAYFERGYTLVCAVSELQDGRLYGHGIVAYDSGFDGQKDIATLRLYLNGQEAAMLEPYAEGDIDPDAPPTIFRCTFDWPEALTTARIVPVTAGGTEIGEETVALTTR